jgi:phage terminase large subunit-like protein
MASSTEWTRPLVTTLDLPKPAGAWFDEEEAAKAVGFFRMLPHTVGRWLGQRFELLPWQENEVVRPLFGWKQKDGTRLYRECHLRVGRKNGKTTLAAGIAGKLTYADREQAGEVYCLATDKAQAELVFKTLRMMVMATPELLERTMVSRYNLAIKKTWSKCEVLSSQVSGAFGKNASGYICDELQEHKDRELLDAMETSTASREQPLGFLIGTAGLTDADAVWSVKDEYTRLVATGQISDPHHLGIIYAIEDDDDWEDESVWGKANPSLGQTLQMSYLRQKAQKAKDEPSFLNAFLRLHLNRATGQVTRFITLADWDATAGIVEREKLKGRECYAGAYMASSTEIAAVLLLFSGDDGYDVLCHFFLPEDKIHERGLRDGVDYEAWAREGLLHLTEGNVIDYAAIRAKFDELARTYQIVQVGHHPWQATQFMTDLADSGMDVVPLDDRSFAKMSNATKELLKLVLERKLRHGGNPVLRRMADSMAVKGDAGDNIKPDSQHSTWSIAGMKALIYALDCSIRNQEAEPSIILI